MSQERVGRLVRRFRRLYAVLTIVLRRDWVVPSTLFLSAIAALTFFLHIVHPVADGPALVGKLLSGVALLFVGYQFSVFRRPEVRKHFEYRGHLVF
jgi:hypothetical protein